MLLRKLPAIALIFLLGATLNSCQHTRCQPVSIERFDLDIVRFAQLDTAERIRFVKQYEPVIDLYLGMVDTISDPYTILENFANRNSTIFFTPEVKKQYADISDLETTLGCEASALREKSEIAFPRVFSAIIPYNQSILVDNSTLIIGLNHYLGSDYEAYESFPEYRRAFKTRAKIAYDVCEAILKSHYPYISKVNTLLERMVYEGVIAAAAAEIVPNFDEATYFSITPEKYQWCCDNESQLWAQLLIDDDLYNTEEITITRYLDPAPYTVAFTDASPGMACRWIGLRIVERYLKAVDDSPFEMLNDKDYQDSQNILIKSQYDGK